MGCSETRTNLGEDAIQGRVEGGEDSLNFRILALALHNTGLCDGLRNNGSRTKGEDSGGDGEDAREQHSD